MVGSEGRDGGGPCTIVDEGHRRAGNGSRDTRFHADPRTVMAHDCLERYYDRLEAMIGFASGPLCFRQYDGGWKSGSTDTSDRLGETRYGAYGSGQRRSG